MNKKKESKRKWGTEFNVTVPQIYMYVSDKPVLCLADVLNPKFTVSF